MSDTEGLVAKEVVASGGWDGTEGVVTGDTERASGGQGGESGKS